MASENKNVIRVQSGTVADTLGALPEKQMFGYAKNDKKIVYKDDTGAGHTFPEDGGGASFSSIDIKGASILEQGGVLSAGNNTIISSVPLEVPTALLGGQAVNKTQTNTLIGEAISGVLGTATVSPLLKNLLNELSPNSVSGYALTTDATNVIIASGISIIRETNSEDGIISQISTPQIAFLKSLFAIGRTYYISVSPTGVGYSNSTAVFFDSSTTLIYVLTRLQDGTFSIVDLRKQNTDFVHNSNLKDILCTGVEKMTGSGILGINGDKSFSISETTLFLNNIPISQNAYSSLTDRFVYTYRSATVGVYTQVANSTIIDFAKYDDGDGTLGTVQSSKYACHWVFRELNSIGKVYVVYGQASFHSVAEAVNDTLPVARLQELAGFSSIEDVYQIIIKGDGSIFSVIDLKVKARGSVGSGAPLTEHNNLLGLQGGTVGEYFHLTNTQQTDLTDAGDSALHYHATDRDRANHTGTQLASTISDITPFARTFLDDTDALGVRTTLSAVEQAGITWTLRTSPADNPWYGGCYGNKLFVIVSYGGIVGSLIATSPDGINWVSRTSPFVMGWISVTYGNGLFVIVANSGGSSRIATSPDGINWVSRTAPVTVNWTAVLWANGIFVAVANSGAIRCMTSPDGISWTSRVIDDNDWMDITYGAGLFVAVGGTGTYAGAERIATSPDGINWTSRTSPVGMLPNAIAYGNGIFVAVANSGTGNRCATSPDGINWTSRTIPVGMLPNAIAYGNGLFVAVANSGAIRCATSPDGINWTSRVTNNNNYQDVFYGNGLFVAVTTSGTGNRVITSGNFQKENEPASIIAVTNKNNTFSSQQTAPYYLDTASTTTKIALANQQVIANFGDIANAFTLNYKFSRKGFLSGNYSGGEVDLPYADWTEDGTFSHIGRGVRATVACRLTAVTFQFDPSVMGANVTAYVRKNGTKTDLGTVTTATKWATFNPSNYLCAVGDEVLFGFYSASVGISFGYPTATAYIRQQ